MANTEIIIRTNNTFKSKDLTKATLGLADCFNSANKAYKDACVILAKVEANKSYKDDGFASLAEYAELIGLNKSAAHKMENAGRLILSDNPVIRDFAAKADYSKLSLLQSEDEDDVAKAIEKGELTPETTAAKVKEWKAARPVKDGKEKVVPTFKITGHALKRVPGTDKAELVPIDVEIGITSPAEWAREYDDTAFVSSVKGGDGETHYTAFTADGSMFTYTAARVTVKEKKAKKAVPVVFDLSELPDDVVAKMIAEYNAKRETGKGE